MTVTTDRPEPEAEPQVGLRAALEAILLVADEPVTEVALAQLLERGRSDLVGAILAAPVRDTLKRAGDDGGIDGTEPRERLWRALTPQLFRRLQLGRALEAAREAGVAVTDESMAMERKGARPLLIEGREDNIKITTRADLDYFEFLLSRK